MEVFSFGMQMELDGKAFCTGQATKMQDANIAHILSYLADEEQKHYDCLKKHEYTHYSLLSSLIEYYDRPSHWLEDAGFTHLEDY